MYSDDEDHQHFPFPDLNASIYLRPELPIHLQHDSPQYPVPNPNYNPNPNSIHNPSQPSQLYQLNGNNKNKYINRINAMMYQEIPLPQDKRRLDTQQKEGGAEDRLSDKLAKSRLSAKMSRDRKKLYMELLETKVNNLEKEVLKSKEQLDTTKGFLDKLVKQNQTISGFTASKHQTMRKLQSIVQRQGEIDVNQINCILDSLRYRIGANGRERVNTLNEYFKQIVNISFPALHRYMMWTASESKHLFSPQSKQEQLWFKQLFDNLGLSQEQKKEIVSKREQFSEQKDVLLSLIEDLDKTKKKIEVKSADLEDEVDVIRNILTPIQCAKFIIFIERNKYRKELNIWDKQGGKGKGDGEVVKKEES